MNSCKMLWGVLRYEFWMQIRRPALWLAFLLCALISLRAVISQLSLYFGVTHVTAWQQAAALSAMTNWLAPLVVGILLADRLARDRRIKVEETLNALPCALQMRLLGKYLGTTLASLAVAFLYYVLVVGLAIAVTGNFLLIPECLVCYVAIVLPGMLFVAAFSLALPIVIWVPLYQFLFFGYWFWGNMLVPNYGLPTLSGTILTPIGSAITAGLFGVSTYGGIAPSQPIVGVASIAALLATAGLAIIALSLFMRWEQARQ